VLPHGSTPAILSKTLLREKDGQGQELGQGGFLVPLLFGKLEALDLKGFESVGKLRATPVTHPDVGSHRKGLCVKMVEGGAQGLAARHLSFSHPEGPDQVARGGTWNMEEYPVKLRDLTKSLSESLDKDENLLAVLSNNDLHSKIALNLPSWF
jgi:hypothetical protein